MRQHFLSLALLAALGAPLAAAEPTHTFTIGAQDFLLDGKPFVIRCGEIHFPRVPKEYWRHRLQLCKAMGLNTVCVYLFWNFHEWQEGQFDWSGQADVAEFCRLAQAEGLWVLLRPGPYSCAEWEMGGLPWWLLNRAGIKLRTRDPKFLEPAVRYLKEVGRVLAPLQVTRGGPLLMAQVENEYGSFGSDAEYMGALRQAMIDGGFDVPLFACNPAGALKRGLRSDLFQVVNFGKGGVAKSFEALRQVQATGPLMNGEYYPGWFDTWGSRHHTGDAQGIANDLQAMLEKRRSFSLYMAHGGTSFGLWAGADRPFKPDTSSYDYDAPISEAGWVTPKFTAIRNVFAQHLQPGESLPEPLPANPVITIAPTTLDETAPVLTNLGTAQQDRVPRHMEAYGQSRGCILYRTTVPAGEALRLNVGAVRDFGWVFLDGTPVGHLDRRSGRTVATLPARTAPARLEILVEAMGRVNFGQEVFDRKGLLGPVTLQAGTAAPTQPTGWEVMALPLDAPQLAGLRYGAGPATGPAFWRGSLNVAKPGDTFLDLRTWGKGVVWINGHCLGRFWNIGPTQTAYVPGPWLKAGANEVVVLDLQGPRTPVIAGLAQPILDEVHPELDALRPRRATGTPTFTGAPTATAAFTTTVAWQTVPFSAPAKGRYVALDLTSAHDGSTTAAIAEVELTGSDGAVLPSATWRILAVDSEDPQGREAENCLDGQPATCWQTIKGKEARGFPHHLILDLGATTTVGGLRYLPKAGDAQEAGRVKDARIFVSDQPFGLAADGK